MSGDEIAQCRARMSLSEVAEMLPSPCFAVLNVSSHEVVQIQYSEAFDGPSVKQNVLWQKSWG